MEDSPESREIQEPKPPPQREVKFEYSKNLARILETLGVSLVVSTYQAGKLVTLGTHAGALSVALYNFERPMGVAFRPEMLAVGVRNQVWMLYSAPDLAPRLDPPGLHDACFLARQSFVTGEIQVHEMHWAGDQLWVVNTLFSCLCTLTPEYNFVPRWRPPFISSLAAEDRCHLNGLAMQGGAPRYVTALAESDTPGGWRPDKVRSGCLIEVPSGRIAARGFAMPHSPRILGSDVWLLDSGRGHLLKCNPVDGTSEVQAQVPGYARGLAFYGPVAFVGLSKIRETSIFGGVPIAERRNELKCGVAVVQLETGQVVATFEFKSGVEEIFDVQVLPGIRAPTLRGPHPAEDGQAPVWLVPQER